MRDVSSPIFHAMLSLLGRQIINLYTVDEIFSLGMIRGILEGYLHDVAEISFDGPISVIKNCFEQVHGRLTEGYRILPNTGISLDLPYQGYMRAIHRRKRDLIDRPEICAISTVALWDLYAESGLHKEYPHQISKSAMQNNLAAFISGRRSAATRTS
jgi:hypothetical protein